MSFDKKLLILFFLILSFLKISPILPEQEINKKYYNNVLDGGMARLFSQSSDMEDIDIYYVYVNISLFKDYSSVDIAYNIKNNGDDKKIYFAYPRLDAKISKIITSPDKKEKKQVLKDGSYIDYSIKADGATLNYDIKKDNFVELMFPFKIGDLMRVGSDISKPIYEEIVDSFNFFYSWYVSEFEVKREEKKNIKVSYITPHYYNTISLKNLSKSENSENLEDPALKYLSLSRGYFEYYESERLFFFPLCSSYINKEKNIDKLVVKINANIIDQDYLKVYPINYKKKGKNYFWKYSNLKIQPMNNILVKINPSYSKNTFNPLLFTSSKSKTIEGHKSYYEFSGVFDDIVFRYDNDELISLKTIKILPEYFRYRSDFKNINMPLEFEILFSDDKDFNNSKKVIKKYSKKKILRTIKRKSYLQIYDGKEIRCKYIKIKILKATKSNEQIRISDFQFIR